MSAQSKAYYRYVSDPDYMNQMEQASKDFIDEDDARSMADLILYQGTVNARRLGLNPRDVETMIEEEPHKIVARAAAYKASEVAAEIVKVGDRSDDAFNKAEGYLSSFIDTMSDYKGSPERFKDTLFNIQAYDNKAGRGLTVAETTPGNWESFETKLDHAISGSFGAGTMALGAAVDFSDVFSGLKYLTTDMTDRLESNVERQIASQNSSTLTAIATTGVGVLAAGIEGAIISAITMGAGGTVKTASMLKKVNDAGNLIEATRLATRLRHMNTINKAVQYGSMLAGTVAGDMNDNAGLEKDTTIGQSLAQAGTFIVAFGEIGRAMDSITQRAPWMGVHKALLGDKAPFLKKQMSKAVKSEFGKEGKDLTKAFNLALDANKGARSFTDVAADVASTSPQDTGRIMKLVDGVSANADKDFIMSIDNLYKSAARLGVTTTASSIVEMGLIHGVSKVAPDFYGDRFKQMMNLDFEFMSDDNLKQDEKNAMLTSKLLGMGQFASQKLMQRMFDSGSSKFARKDDTTVHIGSTEWYNQNASNRNALSKSMTWLQHALMGEQIANVDAALRQASLASGRETMSLERLVGSSETDNMKIAAGIMAVENSKGMLTSFVNKIFNAVGSKKSYYTAGEDYQSGITTGNAIRTLLPDSYVIKNKDHTEQAMDAIVSKITGISKDGNTYKLEEGVDANKISNYIGSASRTSIDQEALKNRINQRLHASTEAMAESGSTNAYRFSERAKLVAKSLQSPGAKVTASTVELQEILDLTYSKDGKSHKVFEPDVNMIDSRKRVKEIIEVFKDNQHEISKNALQVDLPMLKKMSDKTKQIIQTRQDTGQETSVDSFSKSELSEIIQAGSGASVEIVGEILNKLDAISTIPKDSRTAEHDALVFKYLDMADEVANRIVGDETSHQATNMLTEALNSSQGIKTLVNRTLAKTKQMAETDQAGVDWYLERHMNRKLSKMLNNTVWNAANESAESYNRTVAIGKLMAKQLGIDNFDNMSENKAFMMAMAGSLSDSGFLDKKILQKSTYGDRKSFDAQSQAMLDMASRTSTQLSELGYDLRALSEAQISQIALKNVIDDAGLVEKLVSSPDGVKQAVRMKDLDGESKSIGFKIRFEGDIIRIESAVNTEGQISLEDYLTGFTGHNDMLIGRTSAHMDSMTKQRAMNAINRELSEVGMDATMVHNLKVSGTQQSASLNNIKSSVSKNMKGNLSQSLDSLVDAALTMANMHAEDSTIGALQEGASWLSRAIRNATFQNVDIGASAAVSLMADRSGIRKITAFKVDLNGQMKDVIVTNGAEQPRLGNFEISLDLTKNDEALQQTNPEAFTKKLNRMFEDTLLYHTGLPYSNSKSLMYVKIPSENPLEIKSWLLENIQDYTKTLFGYGGGSAEQEILKIVSVAINKEFSDKTDTTMTRKQITTSLAEVATKSIRKMKESSELIEKVYMADGIAGYKSKTISPDVTTVLTDMAEAAKASADATTVDSATLVKSVDVLNMARESKLRGLFRIPANSIVEMIRSRVRNNPEETPEGILSSIKKDNNLQPEKLSDIEMMTGFQEYAMDVAKHIRYNFTGTTKDYAIEMLQKVEKGIYGGAQYIEGNTVIAASADKLDTNKEKFNAMFAKFDSMTTPEHKAQFFLRGMNTGFNTYYSKDPGKRTITGMMSALLSRNGLSGKGKSVLNLLLKREGQSTDINGNITGDSKVRILLAKDHRDVNDGNFYGPQELLDIYAGTLSNKSGDKLFSSTNGIVIKANMTEFLGSKQISVLKSDGTIDDAYSIDRNSIILDMNTFKEFDAELVKALGLNALARNTQGSTAVELEIDTKAIRKLMDHTAGDDVRNLDMDQTSGALLEIFMSLGTHTDIKTSVGDNEFSFQAANNGDSFSMAVLNDIIRSTEYRADTGREILSGAKESMFSNATDKWKHKLAKMKSWGSTTMLQAWDTDFNNSPDLLKLDKGDEYLDNHVVGSKHIGILLEQWVADNKAPETQKKELQATAIRLLGDNYEEVTPVDTSEAGKELNRTRIALAKAKRSGQAGLRVGLEGDVKALEKQIAETTKPTTKPTTPGDYTSDIVAAINAMTSFGDNLGYFQRIDSSDPITVDTLNGAIITSLATRYPAQRVGQMGPSVIKGVMRGRNAVYVDGDYWKHVRIADFDGDTANFNWASKTGIITGMKDLTSDNTSDAVTLLKKSHTEFLHRARFSAPIAPSVEKGFDHLFKDELWSATGSSIAILDVIPMAKYSLEKFFKSKGGLRTMITSVDLEGFKEAENRIGINQELTESSISAKEDAVVFYSGPANGSPNWLGSMDRVMSSVSVAARGDAPRRYHILKATQGARKNLLIETTSDGQSPSESITRTFSIDPLSESQLKAFGNRDSNLVRALFDKMITASGTDPISELSDGKTNITGLSIINNYQQSGPVDQIKGMGLSVLLNYWGNDLGMVNKFIKRITAAEHLGSSSRIDTAEDGSETFNFKMGLAKETYTDKDGSHNIENVSDDINNAFVSKLVLGMETGDYGFGKIALEESELKMLNKMNGNKAIEQMDLMSILSYDYANKDNKLWSEMDKDLPPRALDGISKLRMISAASLENITDASKLFADNMHPEIFSNLTRVVEVEMKPASGDKPAETQQMQIIKTGIELKQTMDKMALFGSNLAVGKSLYLTALKGMPVAFGRITSSKKIAETARDIITNDNSLYSGSVTDIDVEVFLKQLGSHGLQLDTGNISKAEESILKRIPSGSAIDMQTSENSQVSVLRDRNTNKTITLDNFYTLLSSISNNPKQRTEKNMAIAASIVRSLKSYQEVAFSVRASGITEGLVNKITSNSFGDMMMLDTIKFDEDMLIDYFKASRNNPMNYKFSIDYNDEITAIKNSGCSMS